MHFNKYSGRMESDEQDFTTEWGVAFIISLVVVVVIALLVF